MALLQVLNRLFHDGQFRIPTTSIFSIRRITKNCHCYHHVTGEKNQVTGKLSKLSMTTELVNGRAELYNQVCLVRNPCSFVWDTYVLFEINQMGHVRLPIHPLEPRDVSWAERSLGWTQSHKLSVLFLLGSVRTLRFSISKGRQDMKDKLGDLYTVIMWAHLLAAII